MTTFAFTDTEQPVRYGGVLLDVRNAHTADELLKETHLDWEVVQRPLSVVQRDSRGRLAGSQTVESHVANVRTDTGAVVGVVGTRYRVVPKHDAFDFADNLVESGEASWVGARETGGGSRIHAALRINRDLYLPGLEDDKLEPLLFLHEAYDGDLSLTFQALVLRLICLNGMVVRAKGIERYEWKVRHTETFDQKLIEARRALGLVNTYFDQFTDLGERLLALKLDPHAFERFLGQLVPYPKDILQLTAEELAKDRRVTNTETVRAAIAAQLERDDLANFKRTGWGAFNAVAAYIDHDAPVRATGKHSVVEQRFLRLLGGERGALKQRAVDLLLSTN